MSRSRLALVALEDRTVPATLIWTGDVDDRWGTNTLGNTNWAFDMIPHNGDSLLFPASSQHHTNTNNLTGLIINNITVQFRGFAFQGNAITLLGGFVDNSSGPSALGLWFIPLQMSAGSHSFNISADFADDRFRGGIGESGSGPAGIVIDGTGLTFDGAANTYTGLTTVNTGHLDLNNFASVALSGDLQVNAGFFARELRSDQIADTSAITMNTFGRFYLDGFTDTVGPVSILANGRLNTSDQGVGGSHGRLTTGNLSLASGALLEMALGSSGNFSDRITVHGTVQLGGIPHLSATALATAGSTITLIDNDGTDAVIGTFDGLPQGATVTADGEPFAIDYAGGTGNDVVLTRLPGLHVSGTQVNDGAAQRSRVTSLTMTFSAQATFAGTPGTAFTLVRNSDSAPVTFTATATVVGGVTVVTLNNFGGGTAQFGSLGDGRYTLTALADQITSNGQHLDGNADGIPGDDYTFGDAQGLYRFFGDINGDRHVDIADFGLFSSTFNLNSGQTGFLAAFDFNNDGHIDIADFGQFSIRLFTLLP